MAPSVDVAAAGVNLIANHSEIKLNPVADSDPAALDNFREGAATPAFAHRRLESRQRFVHPLAGPRLAENAKPRSADTQRLTPAIEQIKRIDDKVRPSSARFQIGAKKVHQLEPPFKIDDRDLPFSALIRIGHETTAGDERRLRGRIHRPPMGAFDPDLTQNRHASAYIGHFV